MKVTEVAHDFQIGVKKYVVVVEELGVLNIETEHAEVIATGCRRHRNVTLPGGTCFTSWVNISKTQFY